jgi:chromosome segregation ATPase
VSLKALKARSDELTQAVRAIENELATLTNTPEDVRRKVTAAHELTALKEASDAALNDFRVAEERYTELLERKDIAAAEYTRMKTVILSEADALIDDIRPRVLAFQKGVIDRVSPAYTERERIADEIAELTGGHYYPPADQPVAIAIGARNKITRLLE